MIVHSIRYEVYCYFYLLRTNNLFMKAGERQFKLLSIICFVIGGIITIYRMFFSRIPLSESVYAKWTAISFIMLGLLFMMGWYKKEK